MENVVEASENNKRVLDHHHLDLGLIGHAPHRPTRERRCSVAVRSFLRPFGLFSVGQLGNLKATQAVRNQYSVTERRTRGDGWNFGVSEHKSRVTLLKTPWTQ